MEKSTRLNRDDKMQKAIENEKVVPLGFPRPLALDIEHELDKFFKETGRKF